MLRHAGPESSGSRIWVGSLLGLALSFGFGGCGSNAATADAGDPLFATCATETRAMPYKAGMQVASNAATFNVKLVESAPGPPVKGNDTFTVEIDDAAAATPLDGLGVVVTPWMPDHGHGTNPVVVTADGGGRYDLPMYLYMGGYWEIRIAITTPSTSAPGSPAVVAMKDEAMIPICIP